MYQYLEEYLQRNAIRRKNCRSTYETATLFHRGIARRHADSRHTPRVRAGRRYGEREGGSVLHPGDRQWFVFGGPA